MKKSIVVFSLFSLLLTACSSTKTSRLISNDDIAGTWLIEFIKQRPVLDHSPATITFAENNRISGSSSCNRIMASYQLTQGTVTNQLTFGQTAGTRMMCPEALMEQEGRFLSAMPKVRQVRIENDLLVLSDKNNQLLFKASKK